MLIPAADAPPPSAPTGKAEAPPPRSSPRSATEPSPTG
ncbi:hypothetical protein HDA39_005019 [Kribbella italica]|uniref:Uncharacterized protein n=1 Tax=Kribbella italica TaxID=1540520 RepID=A0A7W9JAR6_9ACTN|nr:hypothetical protein [Kribbella italica]